MIREIYVDVPDNGTVKFDATPAMLRALSAVCRFCPGLCCHRFSFTCAYDDDGYVDREAWVAAAKPGTGKANTAYAAANFTLVERCGRNGGVFECRSLKGNRCGDYKGRPPMCRGYYCASAFFDGQPPSSPRMRMISTEAGGPYAGWLPLPGLVCGAWERAVKPVADAYAASHVPRPRDPWLRPDYVDDAVACARGVGCDGSFGWDPAPGVDPGPLLEIRGAGV